MSRFKTHRSNGTVNKSRRIHIHVETNTNNNCRAIGLFLIAAFKEHAANFGAVNQHIVGPLGSRAYTISFQRIGYAQSNGNGKGGQLGKRGFCDKKKRKREILIGPCNPFTLITPPSGGLLPRSKDKTRGKPLTFRQTLEKVRIGRSELVVPFG